MGYVIITIIISGNIMFIIVISELILILILLNVLYHKNVLIFYLFNLIRRFIIFLRLFIRNYRIFCLGNLIKLGLFPFTYIILSFYIGLDVNNFMILNIAKLPYLTLLNFKLVTSVTIMTILYIIYTIYKSNNIMYIITIYSIVSTVIILNINIIILNIYYLIRLSRIYLCLISKFEAIRIYNLLGLPLRLTFYIKIEFLIALKYRNLLIFIVRLTYITLNIVKYIGHIKNMVSKKILILILLNTLYI